MPRLFIRCRVDSALKWRSARKKSLPTNRRFPVNGCPYPRDWIFARSVLFVLSIISEKYRRRHGARNYSRKVAQRLGIIKSINFLGVRIQEIVSQISHKSGLCDIPATGALGLRSHTPFNGSFRMTDSQIIRRAVSDIVPQGLRH